LTVLIPGRRRSGTKNYKRPFHDAADEWIALQKPSRRYNANLLLKVHGKALADVQIYKINKDLVDKAIEPLRTKHPNQAKRTIKLWFKFFAWAEFKGYHVGKNPATWAGALEHTFPSMGPAQHHAFLHYTQVPAFVQKLRIQQERSVSAVAMEFMVLTAGRTSEILEARWNEIQGDMWVIPPGRMKARKEHRVPLSPRAMELLERQRQCSTGSEFIFTGYSGKTALSKKSLYRIACGVSVTAHGFRASFRSWAGDKGFPWDVCEMALAHTVGNRTAQAYSPGDPIDQRRKLMEEWATYCCG
jgi:integrase